MDFTTGAILNLMTTKLGLGAGVGALATSCLCLWYWFRAGSSDALLHRLRQIVVGKHEIVTKELATYAAERRDLDYFRFMRRVSVQSIPELKRVLKWAKDNEIDDDDLKRCRFDIHPKSSEVLKPASGWLAGFMSIFFVTSMLCVLSGAAFSILPLVAEVKATGNWFAVSSDSGRSIFATNAVRFPKEACTEQRSGTQLDKNDVASLCFMMTDPAGSAWRSEQERDQKWFGVVVLVTFGICLQFCKAVMVSAFRSWQICREIETRRSTRAAAPKAKPEPKLGAPPE